jgi:hypothetical protein
MIQEIVLLPRSHLGLWPALWREPPPLLWRWAVAGYDFWMEFCADAVAAEDRIGPGRRQFPRYTLRSLAYVKLDQGNGGIVRDLTESGAAIQAVSPLQAGQEVMLRFDLLMPRVRIETRGRVAWAESNGQSGVQFDPLPSRMRRAVRDWLLLQMLSAAVASGRDTMFALPDPQLVLSEETVRPAIVMPEIEMAESPYVEERPGVRWGPFSLSVTGFSTCLDGLVLLCAVLLFSISSLAVMGGVPDWPLAGALLLTSSTIFAAVYSLLFSDAVCGATPGQRVAMLAAGKSHDQEPAPRFR